MDDWRARAEGLLSDQPCVAHRNGEISALYAALYLRRPGLFKWAGMAAFASHHVRLALWPLAANADADGAVDLPRALGKWQSLHMDDVDVLRRTNNGIFRDVFWAHLAYDGSAEGIDRLRRAIDGDPESAALLRPFEQLERGRLALDAGDPGAEEIIWAANIEILEHEQRELVQPHFDQLSCAFARAFSVGATLGFRVDGLLRSLGLFTTFYGHALTRRAGHFVRAMRLPDVTRLDDRWAWIEAAVAPRFRRYEQDRGTIIPALQEILDEAEARANTAVCGI